MRNPNGYGCIKHLSGRRRRPFVFVVTDAGRQRPVEYFTNLVDAQIFQADYHRTHRHRSLPGHKITLAGYITAGSRGISRIPSHHNRH